MNKSESSTNETWQYLSHGEPDTEALGTALAEVVEAGSTVALVGDLGAGKTRLVQSLAAAMGVERQLVNSPTFILIQEYEGRLPIYHFDTYRLRDADEFLELGAEEIMASEGICLIEWADRVSDVLPADLLWIDIGITGPASRSFRFSGSGPRSRRLVCRLRQRLA